MASNTLPTSQWVVRVAHKNGTDYWLRSTVWTSQFERATHYATREAAEAAFKNSMRFSRPRLFAQIYGIPSFENYYA